MGEDRARDRVGFEVSPPPPGGRAFVLAESGGPARRYDLRGRGPVDYLDLHEALARDFGLRRPLARAAAAVPAGRAPPLTPVLTEPVSPKILYGYGDPCVVRVGKADWRLLVTSNDAPDAFPILRSADLRRWSLQGFVFPAGQAPAWSLVGPGVADFWAPEMHRVGREYWVCFTARAKDAALCIGLARAASPDGPFRADPEPLLRGGVIDPHILLDAAGSPWMVWKKDDNDVWPGGLAALLHRSPHLIDGLFPAEPDRRTAALTAALWPWTLGLAPMEQFFVQQPLIEAVTGDFAAFGARLTTVRDEADPALAAEAAAVLAAMKTRIYAQRLAPDGRSLLGERTVILENDQPWEAHLIEGVWITEEAGRYYLLYAGNDFSTPYYGIGLAVADAPTGPYRKASEAFLTSTVDWWGPGHPSVAEGPDGRRHIFLHAFRPGAAGYKAFRALLSAPLRFAGGTLSLDEAYRPPG